MKKFNFFEKLWEHGRTLKRVGLVLVMCLIAIPQVWAWSGIKLRGDWMGGFKYTSDTWTYGDEGNKYWDVYHPGGTKYWRLHLDYFNHDIGPNTANYVLNVGTNGYKVVNTGDNSFKTTASAGILRIQSNQTTGGGEDERPYVWITRPTVKFKYDFENDGGDWTTVDATDNYDGTYTYRGKYCGVDYFNAGPNDADKVYTSNDRVYGSPSAGDRCEFKWQPGTGDPVTDYKYTSGEEYNRGVFTITKLVTVTFDGNGKSKGDLPSAQEVLYNTATTLAGSCSIEKVGAKFTGWNTRADGEGTHYDVNGSITITSNTTLYAEWEAADAWYIKGGNSDKEDGSDALGDWKISNYFSYSSEHSLVWMVTLAASTTYQFKVVKNNGSETWYGNNGTIDATTQAATLGDNDWAFETGNGNCKLATGSAGTYVFTLDTRTISGNSNPKLRVYFPGDAPKVFLPKKKYIYVNSTSGKEWNGGYTARFWFKATTEDVHTSRIETSESNDLGESGMYYAIIPDNDYIDRVQLNRMNPSDLNGDPWNIASVKHGYQRTNAKQNCLTFPTADGGWSNNPNWDTYCPPMRSATIKLDLSNTDVFGGDGGSSTPYLVATSSSIYVSAESESKVADDNMTPYYQFKKAGSNDGGESSMATHTYTSHATSGTKQALTVVARNYYYTTAAFYGTPSPASDAIYYESRTPYSVTPSLTNITVGSGRTGSKAIVSGVDYVATLVPADGYNLPAAITVTRGATDITANCTWDEEAGTLTIPAAQITDDLTITAAGVPKTTTITLNANTDNHGSGTNKEATATYDATTLTSVTHTTPATGYQLEGYYTTASGEGVKIINANGSFVSSETDYTTSTGKWKYTTSTATLYARYEAKTYDITLNREQGSSGSTSVTMTYNSASHTSITAPTAPTGYTFAGWYTGALGTGTMVMNESGVLQANVAGYTGAGGIWTKDSECTLYAKYTASYPDGYLYITDVKSNPETKAGYTITSAVSSAAFNGSMGDSFASNHSGYQYWARTTGSGSTTLSFSGNLAASATAGGFTIDVWWGADGANRSTTIKLNGGDDTTLDAVSDKNDRNAVRKATYNTELKSLSSIQLLCGNSGAVWFRIGIKERPGYLLTYDDGDGSGAPSAEYMPNATITLSSTVPTYTGHIFVGWQVDGEGTIYAPGASFSMPAEATTLEAKWAEICYQGTITKSSGNLTASHGGETSLTASDATITSGGGIKIVNTNTGSGSVNYSCSSDGMNINTSNGYIEFTLPSGSVLATGSIIRVQGKASNSSYGLKIIDDSGNEIAKQTNNGAIDFTYTVTALSAINGNDHVRINRVTANGTIIKSVSVADCGAAASCSASAEAGDDKSTSVNEGVSMAATAATSGYTGAWSIKDGSPSTSTSQLSSTSAYNATFTPTAAGTYTLIWTVTDDSDGSCSASDEATVTVSCLTAPVAVTSLSCYAHTTNSLTYTWTKAVNASGYTATLYSDSGCETEETHTDINNGNTETVTFSSLTPGTTYYCKVQSKGNGTVYCVDGGTTTAASGSTDSPSISTFLPASGTTVKSGTTVTVTGSTSSTIYYLWGTSSAPASAADVVSGGTAGTSGEATVTTTGISSSNTYLYAVATEGGVNSSISSASYTIDDTAPTLSSSDPADGDDDVEIEGTIVLTFSEALSAVDDTKFSLDGATLGTVAIDVSDNTKVNIAYSGASYSTTVTLATAAGAVTDAVGNTSAALDDIAFTTKSDDYTITHGDPTGSGTYTIQVNSDTPTGDNTAAPKDATITLAASASTGYGFTSWTVTGDVSGDAIEVTNNKFTMPAEAVTVSATFTAINYNITHSAASNGSYTIKVGSADAVSTNTTANYNQTITLAATPDSHYKLSAWNVTKTDGGATVTVTDNKFTMPAEAVTIAPTFGRVYTVSFNRNGASGSDPSSVEQSTIGGTVTMPSAPTYTGYTFQGWMIGDAIYAAGDATYVPTANVTALAIWKQNCAGGGSGVSVRFTSSDKNDNEDYFAKMTTKSNTTQMVGSGSAKLIAINDADLYATTKKDGYRSDSRMEMVFYFETTSTLDVYVTTNSTSRTYGLYSFSSENDLEDITTSDYSSNTIVSTNVSVAGAAFAHTTAGTPSVSSGVITISGTAGGAKISYTGLSGYYVFKAHGSSDSYIYGFDINGGAASCHYVTYDGNGATSGAVNDPKAYTAGDNSALVLSSNFHREDCYEFSCWNTKADGSGTDYQEGDYITVSENITLYAIWRIVIDANATNLDDYEDPQYKDVRVTNGKMLTINKDVAVRNMLVETGSTLKVDQKDEDNGATLTVKNLSLAGGYGTVNDAIKYDMPRVFIASKSTLTKTNSTVNFDIAVTNQYSPIAVPFKVKVSDVNYAKKSLKDIATYLTNYAIRTYDGENRAKGESGNWTEVQRKVEVEEEMVDNYLEPGRGYILAAMRGKGDAFAVIRFPMEVDNDWTATGELGTIDSEYYKNKVTVTAWEKGGGATTPTKDKGWNILGVPFMSCFASSQAGHSEDSPYVMGKLNFTTGEYTETSYAYVNVPTHDFSEYVQEKVSDAVLVPGWCFFIQFEETGTLTFATTGERDNSTLPIYAPKHEQELPIVETGIILSGNEASDKTTIIVSDRYSAADYEINADLEKMFGENSFTLATYSLMGATRLAYNAMSNADAANIIPIGYRAPADGEYTFSINPRYAQSSAFEHVNLIDYETGLTTDLLLYNYTFSTERTQLDTRFALNVVPRQNTPTDIENAAGGINNANGPRKVLINDKMYIIVDGKMYDATGKAVK